MNVMPIHECQLPNGGGTGYQWGDHGKCYKDRADAERQAEAAYSNGYAGDIALDATARTIDTDGRMHISKSHISKAMICPYYGKEIPGYVALGLDAQTVYHLLRAPEALKSAAATFERNPILSRHVPVTADAPRQDLIVGAIGSEVTFNAPYLDADVCIWDSKAIAGIETDQVKEFSCAYHYVPVMQSGEYEGEPYDGIMTEIRGNHLALVESGRAGSDVVAADNNPWYKRENMKMTKLGKALYVALGAASSKLAQDSKLPALVGEASKKTFDKSKVTAALIAMDSSLKAEQLGIVMDAIEDLENDPESKEPKEAGVGDKKTAKDADPEETEEEKKERLEKEAKDKKVAKDAQSAEEHAMWAQMRKDGSADDPADDAAIKPAMDAAIITIKRELREADEAKRTVRPTLGDIVAQDSAESIYGFALDHMKVDHEGVTGVPALKALYKVASSKGTPAPRIAMDSASIETRFPGFNRVRQA